MQGIWPIFYNNYRGSITSKNCESLYSTPVICIISSVQFSLSVVYSSLRPHGLQHARLPCPSPTPGACSNSCPLNWWCHPTMSPSVIPFSSCLQSFQHQGLFKWVSSSHQVAKVLEFQLSISPSNEYSGLFSFRIDWFDLAIERTLKSSPTSQFKSINSLALSFLYSPTFTSIQDYWKNYSFD